MGKIDLTGKKFNRLTVIKEVGKDSRNQILWLCKCDCGNETIATTYRINKGITKSCGCLAIEVASRQSKEMGKKNKTHGLSKTRIYKTYRGMIDRCFNENDQHYPDYGGRGITVCNEWSNKNDGFVAFNNWAIEHGYTDKLTIDRIDVNGNYEPGNCRWADIIIQSRNKRDNRYIEYNGVTKTLSEWAIDFGLKRGTLAARLDRYNMSFEDAISIPGGYDKPRKMYKITNIETGESFICRRKEIASKINIASSSIRHYLDKDKLWKNKYKIDTYIDNYYFERR